MRRQHGFSILDLGFWIWLVAIAAFLVACQPSVKNAPVTPSPSPSASPSASPSVSPSGSPANKVESWIGKWPGPEGTYLTITKKVSEVKPSMSPSDKKDIAASAEKFTIDIANLDGPKTFEGIAKGDHIEFVRNGKTETIKAATGAETGMKGFENEKNCLVVTRGSEGFCRK
jgi:hypothetical protein